MRQVMLSTAAACAVLTSSAVRAEEPAPSAPPAAATAAPAAEATPAPETPAPETAPSTTPEATATPASTAAPTPPAVEAAPPAPLRFMFFADGFANWQTAKPTTAIPWHRAYDSTSPGGGNQNGFGLAFAGLDVNYAGSGWGATTSLRFGPGVPQFYAADTSPLGIENITQAYVTWAPAESLTLDLGQFGTPFGAEVAESWRNKNYTRGGLYYGMQPFWHTGLRLGWAISDSLKLTAIAVDGTNTVALNDNSPNLGLQLAYTAENFSVIVGTLQALDASTNASGFDRFFDIVATLTLDRFSLVFNGDFNINATDPFGFTGTSFWGASLAGGYQFTDWFGLALRGEYLSDMNNALYAFDAANYSGNVDVATGTVTLDFKPIPNSSNLIIRWDNRVEWSTQAIYSDFAGGPTQAWYTSVLGLVATTDGLF
jgi:hypothetical protein